jgi:hypothetical protein
MKKSLQSPFLKQVYIMDNISSTSNLSNWTLSLVVGVKAALTSSSQKGIVGEFPFSDLLLTISPKYENRRYDTVLISKQSRWATMLHKSFWAKGLESLHITIDDIGRCPSSLGSNNIAPSMFYGLLEFHEGKASVYTREQIKRNRIHESAYMYLGQKAQEILAEKTNENCILEVKKFMEALKERVARSDVYILDQAISLINGKLDNSKWASEIVDRIFSRIGPMCKREGIDGICCGSVTINATDLIELITVALGISRALAFSDSLYNNGAILVVGFDIAVTHEMLSDMTEVPSEEQMGFSASYRESSHRDRIININLNDNKTLIMPIIELSLTIIILYLSKLGPLLSMYVSRQSMASYRESTLRRGSSMRWSISNIRLHRTGISRDDWMMSITSRAGINIQLWRFFLVLCCIVPFGFWAMWASDVSPQPDPKIQRILPVIGLVGGIIWMIMCIFSQLEDDKNKDIAKYGKYITSKIDDTNLMGNDTNLANDEGYKELLRKEGRKRTKGFLLLLIPIIYMVSFFSVKLADDGSYGTWVYAWVFEIGCGVLWGVGELLEGTDMGWIIESTSFYMMGILSAIRLA